MLLVQVLSYFVAKFVSLDFSINANRHHQLDTELKLLLVITVGIVMQLALLGCILFLTYLRPVSMHDYLGMHLPHWSAIAFGVIAFIPWMAIQALILYFLDTPPPEIMIELLTDSEWLPYVWLLVAVIAPVVEEVVFRGFMWRGLIGSEIGLHGTVVMTSLGWVLLHLGQYREEQLLLLGVTGLILGYARHLAGNVWVPMAMHGFNNLLAIGLVSHALYLDQL